jgi:hypothetical protein
MKLHLVLFNTNSNFGKDNYYDESINRLKKSFLENGGDEIHHYTEETIPLTAEYRQYCEEYRNKSFGFYGFKPVIIQEVFKKINYGDMVLYHDAGRPEYKYEFKTDLKKFAFNIKFNFEGLGVSHGFWKHSELTRNLCFTEMGCNTPFIRNKYQLAANWGFYEKNLKVINFINEWKNWCSVHEVIRTEEKDEENHKEFKTHRWDQSILTNLLYLYSFKTLPYFGEWEKDINNFIIDYSKINICTTFNEIDGKTVVLDIFYKGNKLVVITPNHIDNVLVFNSIKPASSEKGTTTNRFLFEIPYIQYITLSISNNGVLGSSLYYQFNVNLEKRKLDNNTVICSVFDNTADKLDNVLKFIEFYSSTGVDKLILCERSGENYKEMLLKLKNYIESDVISIYCCKGVNVENNGDEVYQEIIKSRFKEVKCFVPIKLSNYEKN